MNYKILQLRDMDKYGFMDYEFALRHNFDLRDYNVMFESELDETITDNNSDTQILEIIFRLFNRVNMSDIDRLEQIGFKGHSLSTSDVVMLDKDYYYCDSFGWEKINQIVVD